MAVLEHRKHILISRPRRDEHTGLWIPYASVVCDQHDLFVYQRFTEIEQRFATEQEAEGFGFAVARGWVDKER